MEPETFQVNHLHDYEVTYELATRNTKTTRNLNDQRKILRRLIAKEVNQPGGKIDLSEYKFDFQKEQREIEKTIYEITEGIIDFAVTGDENDRLFSRLKSRIVHVTLRARNLGKFLDFDDVVEANMRDQVLNYCDETYATCLKIEGDLHESIKVDPNNPAVNTMQGVPVINVAAPIITCSGNSIPISEWGIKFSGEGKNLFSFLERVTELAHARKISEDDLFNSSVELFVGDAFAWFRCNKANLTNWDDLVTLLKRDFLHSDAEDQIWEQIKHRKQKKSESVAIFIAHMETLFRRLGHMPAEVTKIKNIRQNLLSESISQLALVDITSVSELRKYCRKLEEANYLKNKNKSHEVSELSEQVHPSTSFNRGYNNKPKINSQNKNYNNKNFDIRKSSNNSDSGYPKGSVDRNFKNESSSNTIRKSVSCWNCGLANHTFHECRAKRNLFCFKCGMADVKSGECKRCSKN